MDWLSIGAELAVGLAVGIMSGIMGLGGGVLLVPALVLLLGVGQHVAQGISLVAIVPAALSGTIAHRRRGNVVLPLVPILGVSAILFALLGAWLADMLDALVLRRIFGVFLVLISLRMFLGK